MFKQIVKTASTIMLAAGISLTSSTAPATIALAAELTAFDSTSIEQDLAAVDLSAYTENADGRHTLLDEVGFMEYAYSNDPVIAADYFGLYFYVYNCTGREVSIRAGANAVNMAVEYDADGEPTEYANCAITILDHTDDHLIYKFKLTNSADVYDRVRAYASAYDGVRRYDIAGIQLWFAGDATATDSDAVNEGRGITYRCTGYGKGCGTDKETESTLQIMEEKLDTVSLEVQHTFYRYQRSEHTATQLTSVYFAVENEYLEKYGDLYAIKAEYYEYITSPILIISDDRVYDTFYAKLGQDISEQPNFAWAAFTYHTESIGIDYQYILHWYYGNNFPSVGFLGIDLINPAADPAEQCTKLAWLFKSDDPLNETISETELKDYMNQYTLVHGSGSAYGGYNDDLFAGGSGHQEIELTGNDLFNLDGFDTGNALKNWLASLFAGYSDIDITDIKAIQEVTSAHLESSDICDELLIDESDKDEFIQYCEKAAKEDKTVFLFRFDTSDYVDAPVIAVPSEDEFYAGWNIVYDQDYRQETVYLGFDIISLTFRDRDNLTIIPVVSSPVDIVAEIRPNHPSTNSGIDWKFIAILSAVAVMCIVGIAFTLQKGD